jgi:hypothetical protein
MPLRSGMRKLAVCLLAASALVSCTRRETREQPASNAANRTDADITYDASVPASGSFDSDNDLLERGRRDTSWITAARTDLERRQALSRSGGPMIHPRSNAADSLAAARRRQLTGGATGTPGAGGAKGLNLALPGFERLWTGQGADSLPVLTVQVWLDRVEFSPGVLDGEWGKNTAKALYWFQDAYGLTPTGNIDPATLQLLERLTGDWDPVVRYTVSAEDVKGPFTPLPDDVYEKAKLPCLCYANALEGLGEKFHTRPEFLTALNGGKDLASVAAGTELQVPHIDFDGREGATADSVARIIISKRGFYTHALDASGNILYHFPSTLGSKYDPSPEGNLKITGIAFDPPFHYQPKLFHDVPDTEPEAHLPAGPNSPVGLVWMQLSKENYGIHGTATPETIGYESSHGCIRLTNWDAVFLAHHVKRGVPVEFSEANQAAVTGGGNETGGR